MPFLPRKTTLNTLLMAVGEEGRGRSSLWGNQLETTKDVAILVLGLEQPIWLLQERTWLVRWLRVESAWLEWIDMWLSGEVIRFSCDPSLCLVGVAEVVMWLSCDIAIDSGLVRVLAADPSSCATVSSPCWLPLDSTLPLPDFSVGKSLLATCSGSWCFS